MRLVVDTNRIIAALIKDSISRESIFHLNAQLIAIPLLKEEVLKHKSIIVEKAALSETTFDLILQKLYENMDGLDEEIPKKYREEAAKIMDKIDPDDTQFIAAALATNSDIWSDDTHFTKQNKVKVWTTKELIKSL